MDSVVHLREAVAVLGRFPALAGVSLDVAEGEVVHLRGPNGAGKSTLLRLLAGLVVVRSGLATVLGHDLIQDHRSVRPYVGLLSHDTHLYEELTVEENVSFRAAAAGVDPGGVEPALVRLDLSGRLRTVPVGRLSAGQRRRTSLAAMIVRRPRLWLLDEPHASLDQSGRDLVDRLIADAVAAGATVVVASHELDRASGVATRSVELVGGVMVDASPPRPAAGLYDGDHDAA